jgi:chemotaxis protein methyltransferase CheR
MNTLSPADFTFVCELVRQRSAIVLEAGKEYLVVSRLTSVAQQNGFSNLGELVTRLRSQPMGPLPQKVVEAITTNETSFFRDLYPFDVLKKEIVPEILQKRAAEKRLTIWCGAASTGQEPYTIALVLKENFPQLENWSVKIIATDINNEVLEQARSGVYSQIEVNRGLPAPMLIRHFEKVGSEWRIKEPLRKMIEFRPVNLISYWPAMPPVDIVFLRNVLIYFDQPTKREILGKIRKVMRPDGYLFLGGAETTINLDESFERTQFDRASCYKIRGAK